MESDAVETLELSTRPWADPVVTVDKKGQLQEKTAFYIRVNNA